MLRIYVIIWWKIQIKEEESLDIGLINIGCDELDEGIDE